MGRKQPKPLSGIETLLPIIQELVQVPCAANNLNPYQGLKLELISATDVVGVEPQTT